MFKDSSVRALLDTYLIVTLLYAMLQSPVSDAYNVAALEHERHATFSHLSWLELQIARLLVRDCVWAVSGHDIVQTCACRLEATAGLCIVLSANETHEFRHRIAVVPGRSKCLRVVSKLM